MTFLNWILLGGTLAFSIPLIIHLLNRSRFQVVEWGAMHLLNSVVRINRRRVKIEQLILLLVRCAIPVIIALCMARPVITGWKSLTGDEPTSAVILIDNSYSMDAASPTGSSFQHAIDAATHLVNLQQRGSETSIIQLGGGAVPVTASASLDPERTRDALKSIKGEYGSAEVNDGFKRAVESLKKMTHAKRDVIVVSDFQQRDWDKITGEGRQRVSEVMAALNPAANLTFYPVGEQADQNISVDAIDLDRMVVGVGQKIRLTAHITNHGDRTYRDLRLKFLVDGEEVDQSRVRLDPHQKTQALFTHTFDKAGSTVVQIEADADDLKADNHAAAAVPVIDSIPVLLIDGDPDSRLLYSETGFLRMALAPVSAIKKPGQQRKLADLLAPTVVPVEKFDAASLEKVRAVVMANVPRLNPGQVQLLRGFVEAGGGLLIFPGDEVDLDWYNNILGGSISGQLMPTRMIELAGSTTERAKFNRIAAQRFDHPALEMFNDPRQGDVSRPDIRAWYRLADPDSSLFGPDQPRVIARLSGGDPLMISRRYGEGEVIQVATAVDADWTNLPVRPVYVPLMQQLVVHLASRADPSRNVHTGQALVALLDRSQAYQPQKLVDPLGETHEVVPEDRGRWAVMEYADTQKPGVYKLMAESGQITHFVVAADREESNLQRLDDKSLNELAESMHAAVVRDTEQYAEVDSTRRHGREIWRVLLWASVALLVGEVALQQWFAGRRR